MRQIYAGLLALGVVALSGCSDPGPASSGGLPSDKDKVVTGEPATTKAQYLPFLENETKNLNWPKDFTISAEQIWKFTEPIAQDTLLTASNAEQSVAIYSTCAWSLELIDDLKESKSVEQDLKELSKLSKAQPGMSEFIDGMVSEAGLGDITSTRQFVKANECDELFPQ